mmetsp:Transcript_27260/g.71827  ORF Transcript_27260/g.71827 Transcript_27260/m.71827 type:complete len:97 (+) Transcript_27260:315-605(+)
MPSCGIISDVKNAPKKIANMRSAPRPPLGKKCPELRKPKKSVSCIKIVRNPHTRQRAIRKKAPVAQPATAMTGATLGQYVSQGSSIPKIILHQITT